MNQWMNSGCKSGWIKWSLINQGLITLSCEVMITEQVSSKYKNLQPVQKWLCQSYLCNEWHHYIMADTYKYWPNYFLPNGSSLSQIGQDLRKIQAVLVSSHAFIAFSWLRKNNEKI